MPDVVRLGRGVGRTLASKLTPVSVVTWTVCGVLPSFSVVMPVIEKVWVPVRPNDSALFGVLQMTKTDAVLPTG